MSTSDVARRVRTAFAPPPSVLRRGSDRIEVAARWALLLLGLLLVPVALSVGGEVTTELESRIALQQAERHRVTAEVLAPTRRHHSGHGPDAVDGDLRAPVRWTAVDGSIRVAEVRVAPGEGPGEARSLWVDRAERPTVAPMTHVDAAAHGGLVTVFVLVADLVLSLLSLGLLRRVLDRRRLQAWEAAWRRFAGPGTETVR